MVKQITLEMENDEKEKNKKIDEKNRKIDEENNKKFKIKLKKNVERIESNIRNEEEKRQKKINDKNLIKKINIYNIDKKKISYSHLNQVIQEKIIVYLNRYDLHIETNLELLGDDINSLFSYFLKTKYWSPWNFIIDLGNYNEAKEILLKFIKVRKYPHINLFEYCNCDNISNETYNCSICKKSRKSINDILITSKYNDWEIYQLKKLIVSIGNNFNINWNSNYTIKYYDEKIKPYSPIKIFCEDDINLVYYVLNCWYYSNKSKKINLSNIPIEILGIVIKFLI
jgi:hypothetical protein